MSDFEFTSHADEVLEAFEKATANALTAIGMTAESYAKKELYPGHGLDTGRLRNSVSHAVKPSENAVYIGSNVEYAPYIELGTRNSRPIPFLRPAATEHTAEYEKLAKEAFKNA